MKSLLVLILTLTTSQSLACLNRITLENARKAIALEPNVAADPQGELCFDGIDWQTAELKEVMRPVTHCETNEQGEELCQVVGEEPTGQFELKESSLKKLAKEAKQKAIEDAAQKAKEAKATRQATFKEMATKNGNFTTAEIQRLLKSLAQERSDEAAGSDLAETQLKVQAQQKP